MSDSNTRKGDDLEDATELVLYALKSDGHVIVDYRLRHGSQYPDFWVLDAKGREWLIECKNLAPMYLLDHEPRGVWQWSKKWVEANILNKEWEAGEYQVRSSRAEREQSRREKRDRVQQRKGNSGITIRVPRDEDGITIRVHTPIPALVVSVWIFSKDAHQALIDFFGRNIVTLGRPTFYGGPWGHELYNGLRRLFTS